MINQELWAETKFVKAEDGYSISMDPEKVAVGSRFIASIQVKIYQNLIERYVSGLLLDLGCGNVPLYQMYKDHITDNICVDWCDSVHQNIYLDYTADINNRIPLGDETFDTVLMTDVLEHISNPEFVMSEISRVLKPKGKLILTVPFFYWLHESPHDYFRYTEFSLKMFCTKNRLNILLLETYGGALEIILDIIAKQITSSSILSSLHFRLSKIFVRSKIGLKLSGKTSKQFPLGYCLVAEKADLQ
jgi:SAM-dependent methyltransferase